VYEVDHPATQSWKRARVKELGIKSPRTLRHIPIDFEHETLISGLTAGGVNRNAKAFFSCLGVTQYLTRDAVLNTLREITSATAPGTELVVQFIVPAATLSREEGNLVTAAAARAATMGEPWLSFFDPDDLETNMTQIGFDQIVHFGSKEATERYLLGRTDGLTLPGFFRMIKARVG
jgi:methyltransferase (TIGR00027 family)